jgi:hypothetical protein
MRPVSLPLSLALFAPLAFAVGCDPANDESELEFRLNPNSDPGPTGPIPDPGGPTAETTDFVVCQHRISGDDADVGRGLPYCATAGLVSRYDFSKVKRIVIAQHGRGGDATRYFDKLTASAKTAADKGFVTGETFVIAPQFIASSDVNDASIPAWMLGGVIWWKNDSDWPLASASTDGGGTEYSSFHLIERLLDKHIAKMPNLEEIIFTGQSAGGQTVHRFALLNSYSFPASVDVRYYPANPYAYTYLTSERPTYEDAPDAYSFMPGDTNDPWDWAETEICWDLGGESLPDDFDDFYLGMKGLPSYALAAGDDEAETAEALRQAYLGRDVTYLVGEVDVVNDPNSDCSPGVQAQGRHRRERAHAYHQHALDQGANHHIVRVPDVGHGDALYGKSCVVSAMFGAGGDCAPMEDAEIGDNWVGETTDIAFGNLDGDAGLEVAVLSRINDTASVYLLDDASNGFALLQNVTAGWIDQHQPTSVAFGDVMGDDKIELVVGRRTTGIAGGGGIVVFEDNGPGVQQAWEHADGRDVVAVTTGNVNGNPHADIGVAYDAAWAVRWEVLAWSAVGFGVSNAATFLDASRPIDIQFSNVQADDDALEILVASDAHTGPRLYIYDPGNFTKEMGAGWTDGDELVAYDTGPWDGDGAAEIAIARTSDNWTWAVFDDASTDYTLQRFGAPYDEPTSIAMGSMGTWYGALAVSYADAASEQVELRTYFNGDTPVLGHMHRDADLPVGAHVGALQFGDVDGHGRDELVIGRAGVFGAGWRVKVVAAP